MFLQFLQAVLRLILRSLSAELMPWNPPWAGEQEWSPRLKNALQNARLRLRFLLLRVAIEANELRAILATGP